LHEIFTNERHDVSVRRLAAKDLLNYLHQTDDFFGLDERVTRLEMKQ
jgi:hypothetical protein